MASQLENSKRSISEKKLSLIRNSKNELRDVASKLCSLRPEYYDILEEQYLQELNQIEQNLTQENYFLFTGRFSSGKSSFINAMSGCNILPTASGPCTSVVTEVRFFENCGKKSGRIVYKNESEEEKTQDELLDLIKGSNGKQSISAGTIHHIELNLDINQIGEKNADLFKPFVDKIVLVDCPGFYSPYSIPEDILGEYFDKASLTFYFLPADGFGGDREMKKLAEINKRTAKLIPIVSKSDLITDDEEKERICDAFERKFGDRFNDDSIQPIFISTDKYNQLSKAGFSDVDNVLAQEKLYKESGIDDIFGQISQNSKGSELNERKIELVSGKLKETVEKLYKSSVNEKNYWQKELNRAGYDLENSQYKVIEDNIKRINAYIEDQSVAVGKELRNKIRLNLSELMNTKVKSINPSTIESCFTESYKEIQDRYSVIWGNRFKEFFSEFNVKCSMIDPEFKSPDLSTLPLPGNFMQKLIDGISKSSIKTMLTAVLGVAGLAVLPKLGLILLAIVAVKNIPVISSVEEKNRDKYINDVKRRLFEIIDNESDLNFDGTIRETLSKYRDDIYASYKISNDGKVNRMLANYRISEDIKNSLEKIQVNLSQHIN